MYHMKDIFLKEIYIKVQYFKKAGGVFFKDFPNIYVWQILSLNKRDLH